MGFREVSVVRIKEILRLWLRGRGLRPIARLTQTDRKTVRRYVDAAQALGLKRGDSEDRLNDEVIAEVLKAGKPRRSRRRVAGALRAQAVHRREGRKEAQADKGP